VNSLQVHKKTSKIIIIGPVYPWRGGIAHSTYILAKNLSINNDVSLISFYKQYPLFLYPGKEQKEKATYSREFEFSEFKVDYLLNPLNPISWIKALDIIKEVQPDGIIFKWWHPFFSLCYTSIALAAKNLLKSKPSAICYCHNVLPHEGSVLGTLLTRLFFKSQDYFVCLSSDEVDALKKVDPNADCGFLIEPTYDEFFSKKTMDKTDARRALNIKETEKMILYFGLIRRYKGIEYLIEAFPKILSELKYVKLYIVGEWWIDKSRYIESIEKLGLKDNIMLIDKYVSEEDVKRYFSSADLMILPYTSATQSAVLQLAFAYDLPVIATRVGSFKDLIVHGKTGFLIRPQNSDEIVDYCLQYFQENLGSEIGKNINAGKEKLFGWNKSKEDLVLKPVSSRTSEKNNWLKRFLSGRR